jgi:hypothetical protein
MLELLLAICEIAFMFSTLVWLHCIDKITKCQTARIRILQEQVKILQEK